MTNDEFAKRLQSDAKAFGELADDMGGVAAGFGEGRTDLLKRAAVLDAEVADLRKVARTEGLCKVTAEVADGCRNGARSLGRAAEKAQAIVDMLERLASAPLPLWALPKGDGA